jgi:hypothetical protein
LSAIFRPNDGNRNLKFDEFPSILYYYPITGTKSEGKNLLGLPYNALFNSSIVMKNHTNMAIQRHYADDSPFDERVEDTPPILYYDVDDKPFDERSLCSKRDERSLSSTRLISEINIDAFEEDDNSTTYLRGTQYDDEFSFSLYDQSTIQTEESFDSPTILKRIHSRKSRRRWSNYFPSCQTSSLCGSRILHNHDNDNDCNGSEQSEFSYSDISSLFMCTRLGKGSVIEDGSDIFCMIMKDFKTFFYLPPCSFRSKPFPKPEDWKEYTSLHACLDASAAISCN